MSPSPQEVADRLASELGTLMQDHVSLYERRAQLADEQRIGLLADIDPDGAISQREAATPAIAALDAEMASNRDLQYQTGRAFMVATLAATRDVLADRLASARSELARAAGALHLAELDAEAILAPARARLEAAREAVRTARAEAEQSEREQLDRLSV